MTALLTSSQLASIQTLGLSGMTTSVGIYPTTLDTGLDNSDDAYGSTLTYASSPSATVLGWLVGTWATSRDTGIGDINTTTLYKLRLPVGTTIRQGWVVKISGNEYLVEDAGTDQTWPEWLTCMVKRNK